MPSFKDAEYKLLHRWEEHYLKKQHFVEKKGFEFYGPIRHPLPSTGCLQKQSQDCGTGACGQLGGEMIGLKQQNSWEALLNKGFCPALAAAEARWMKIAVKYIFLIKKQSYMKIDLLMWLIWYETKEYSPKVAFKKEA